MEKTEIKIKGECSERCDWPNCTMNGCIEKSQMQGETSALRELIEIKNAEIETLRKIAFPKQQETTKLPGINPDEVIPSEPDKRKL